MFIRSNKIQSIVLFIILPFIPVFSQNYRSESEYLPHKRPPVPKHSSENHIGVQSEENEEKEIKTIETFSTNTKKKKVKKRETIQEQDSTLTSSQLGELDSDKKAYIIKQGIATIKSYENKKNASQKISNILLNHPIPDVREEAARSLGRLRTGSLALQRAITTDSYSVRRQAFISLEKVGGKDLLKYFVAGVKSSDPEIRIASFKGLGKTNHSYARDLIINEGLASNDTNVVSAALAGLGNFSRSEDLAIFKKYLPSEVLELQIGAIKGLGNSKSNGCLELLTQAITENPNLMPEIIYSISQKNNLHSTLLLFKILQTSDNENYKLMIQRELHKRQAYGKYAVVKTPTASLKNAPQTNSERIAVLVEGDIARVKNTTEKLFKAKMNNETFEDRYYLIQAINPKDKYANPIVEGWVFGPKLNYFSFPRPSKLNPKGKKPGNLFDLNEENEDESGLPSNTTIEKKDKNSNSKEDKPSDKKKPSNPEFDDEDE